MQVPRLYFDGVLQTGERVHLSEQTSRHVLRVLRLREGAELIIFNGRGGEYSAKLSGQDRDRAVVDVNTFHEVDRRSPLTIHLGQSIVRGERMDYAIQKSVELGVSAITPVFTERCGVQLKGDRLTKRLAHWRAVAVGACEQSGRTHLPEIFPALPLAEWLAQSHALGIVADPEANRCMVDVPVEQSVSMLIGPEGGFSDEELALTRQHNFIGVQFGPRILRVETASVVALTMLQGYYGDFK